MLKSKKILNEEMLAAWAMLEAMRRIMEIQQTDAEGMQRLMRAFAIEVCRQQRDPHRIIAGDITLIKFPNDTFSSKADYLDYHARNTVWGEDAILFPVLEVLGYQPILYLQGTDIPPYVPFVQQASDEPLRIEIVNSGAKSGGTHWGLKGMKNAGNGNCMYHTIAQQVQKDIGEIQTELPVQRILETQQILKAAEQNKSPVSIVKSPTIVREENVVTREIQQLWKEFEKADEKRRVLATKKLETLSTNELVILYKISLEAEGDYLKGRLNEIEKEYHLNPKDPTNFMRQAIEKNTIDLDFEDFIREELIHALSVDAWRSESAFHALMDTDSTKLAGLGNSKKCAEEAMRHHSGVNALNAQPGFKLPRLVK